MKWSDEHDLILCRKVLVVVPFIGRVPRLGACTSYTFQRVACDVLVCDY